jgi:hypothetical protein
MPLTVEEAATAVASVMRIMPRFWRWSDLTRKERKALILEAKAALERLAVDIAD